MSVILLYAVLATGVLAIPLAAGLVTVAARQRRHSHQVPAPAVAARTVADERRGQLPDDPRCADLLEVCPVCGMADGERFRLKVGTATWHGWPAHSSCLEWLGEEPSPAPASAAEARYLQGATEIVAWPHSFPRDPQAFAQEAFGRMAPVQVPMPMPRVSLHFPKITTQQIVTALSQHRGGKPVLVGDIVPGDMKICLYGAPDYPRSVVVDGETMTVQGGGPLDGGFTLLMLSRPAKGPHFAGVLVTPA